MRFNVINLILANDLKHPKHFMNYDGGEEMRKMVITLCTKPIVNFIKLYKHAIQFANA